jgi:N-acetylmuramoyl-L-alanine amidase
MEMSIRTTSQILSHRFIGSRSKKRLFSRRLNKVSSRSRRRFIRFAILSANIMLLVGVIAFVIKSPTNSQSAQSASLTDANQTVTGPLDQVSSADIAVHLARATGLPEANSVVNHADSISAVEATAPADTSVVAKPQVVSGAIPSRKDIQKYVTQPGDTLSSIATKFGVTSDSIKWSNGVTGSTVAIGVEIVMPPNGLSGIVYTVKAGDTPDTLAQKFAASKENIISFNDAEVSGLKPGERILIPDGSIQAPVARASSYNYVGFAWGGSAVYGANGYDYGWCTWHAANRRIQIGRPVPSNMGNAISWYSVASRSGVPVGDSPAAGAVLWHARLGGWGHVAFVEKINEDGSLEVSDMNFPIWGRVTYRTVPPSEFGNYKFIY